MSVISDFEQHRMFLPGQKVSLCVPISFTLDWTTSQEPINLEKGRRGVVIPSKESFDVSVEFEGVKGSIVVPWTTLKRIAC